jgi:hypothetical protein
VHHCQRVVHAQFQPRYETKPLKQIVLLGDETRSGLSVYSKLPILGFNPHGAPSIRIRTGCVLMPKRH